MFVDGSAGGILFRYPLHPSLHPMDTEEIAGSVPGKLRLALTMCSPLMEPS